MAPLITCLGEALVDFLPIGAGGRTSDFRMHGGGAPFNVAVAAARLGQRVALASKVGDDLFGRFLRTTLEREGVDTRWFLEAHAPTTLAFVSVEDGEPTFAFYGAGAADSMLTISDLPEELFEQSTVLHVGSISLQRGTTPGTVATACERLRGQALLSLDPNLRPSLVRDEPGYRMLLARLMGVVDLVKVSVADLSWLAPGEEIIDAASALLSHGPALVVVTRPRDALALRPGTDQPVVLRAASFEVAVADTVGAGDAFAAGLLTRLVELGATSRSALAALADADLTDAIRFAAATAALNCTRPGADPPRRKKVEQLLSADPQP